MTQAPEPVMAGAIVPRPAPLLAPGRGLLRNEHFQIAYVTNDLERACAVMGSHYGIGAYASTGGLTPLNFVMHVRLAWVGGTMIELISAEGENAGFYNDRLPADGSFAIRHHHLGYFVRDEAGWDALQREIAVADYQVVINEIMPDFLRVCYIAAPHLGHYLEFIYPQQAAIDFFANVPAS